MTSIGGAREADDDAAPRLVRAAASGGRDGFHVFVYGTLRSGGTATVLLERCVRVGAAEVNGTLYDIDGRFPALLLYGTYRVQGEVWRCPMELLRPLDEFEGADVGLFRRVCVRAGGIVCWTYVAGPALARELTPARRLESGEWKTTV